MEDERQVEMDCISAIFPEMVQDSDDPFSAYIELPVKPNSPVRVVFPASAESFAPDPSSPPQSKTSHDDGQPALHPAHNVESHNLSHLPPLQLHITLPEGYPSERAPIFKLSTAPEWLPRSYLDELQDNGERMWEQGGRTEVVFGYIDSLQQAAETAFGHSDRKGLEVQQEFKIALLDYDIKATQAAFDKETFDCGVCLDPKKGSACHRMLDCGHVFCVQCLQDFYNNAITEGDLVSVRCLAPGCTKERTERRSKKGRKAKTQLSPSELLQIPLEHEMVKRYVILKHKANLESDKNTVYCPRKWCQGAARSKKHRKPNGFEMMETDDEADSDAEDGGKEKFRAGKDLLSVCEDCSFAFCSRCYQGWHGEFTLCVPMTKTGELTEEDKASMEYLKLHTTPCPTCAAPAQKTHGCNHMICFKCNTHFCYLCSAWLEPSNPYKHYNMENTGCFMRLWELEAGDGDDVGIGYAGGVQNHEVEVFELVPEDIEEEPAVLGPEGPGLANGAGQMPPGAAAGIAAEAPQIDQDRAQPAVQAQGGAPLQQLHREGPLILRINAQPPPAPAVQAVLNPPNDHPRGQRRGNPNRRIEPGAQQPGRRPGQPGIGGRGRLPHPQGDVARDEAREEAHQQWVQRFVQMALNDEEDLVEWDSDDEDAAGWEIPVR